MIVNIYVITSPHSLNTCLPSLKKRVTAAHTTYVFLIWWLISMRSFIFCFIKIFYWFTYVFIFFNLFIYFFYMLQCSSIQGVNNSLQCTDSS